MGNDLKTGFWITVGVLAALIIFAILSSMIPALR
jgi:hypothetical protein